MLRFGVLPAFGFALTAWLWFSLSALALTVGLVWIGVGIVWLAVLTRGFRRRPPEVEFDDEAPAPERVVA